MANQNKDTINLTETIENNIKNPIHQRVDAVEPAAGWAPTTAAQVVNPRDIKIGEPLGIKSDLFEVVTAGELNSRLQDLRELLKNEIIDQKTSEAPTAETKYGRFPDPPLSKSSPPVSDKQIEFYPIELTDEDLNALEHLLERIEILDKSAERKRKTPPETINIPISHHPPQGTDTMAKKRNGWFTDPASGTRKHYVNGQLHCDNGPAEIRTNGTQLYYRHGMLHRDGNLPAMIGSRGTQKYAVDGKYHRIGGLPAITWSKGNYRQEWWVNGEIQKAVTKDGILEYFAPGFSDRDDAILSRTDGPARIHPNGGEEYWLNGTRYLAHADWMRALAVYNEELRLQNELIDEDPMDDIAEEVVEAVEQMPATIKSPQPSLKESRQEKKMEKPSFTEMLKQNAVEAGYRVGAKQSTALVKNAVLTVMKNKGAEGGAIQGMSAFLDTEFGEALISFMLGTGLHYVPHFNEDPRVQRLAENLRVEGMATAGNAIVGEAMAHLLPALTEVLNKLPAAEETSNVRVVESAEHNQLAESLEKEEAEEEVAAVKTMKA